MRRIHSLSILTFVCVGLATPMLAQQQTVEIATPFKAQTLAGTVRAGAEDTGIQGVSVQECSEEWKAVVDSSMTDIDGHFAFRTSSQQGMHYLRLSAPGFDPMLIRVLIGSSGGTEFSVHMKVAN